MENNRGDTREIAGISKSQGGGLTISASISLSAL
jgi:hypothetical protein